MSELIDNRARRVSTLKNIIQHLHKGEAPDAVKAQVREMVRQTNPSEIMAMEQELISGGMPVEEVRSMCDLHSQVTREVLVQLPAKPITPGHPVDTFRRENAAIREVIEKMPGNAELPPKTRGLTAIAGATFAYRRAIDRTDLATERCPGIIPRR